jgi:hypothetical protein
MIDQPGEYDLGYLDEREGVLYASPAFLDQANAPLYLRHLKRVPLSIATWDLEWSVCPSQLEFLV